MNFEEFEKQIVELRKQYFALFTSEITTSEIYKRLNKDNAITTLDYEKKFVEKATSMLIKVRSDIDAYYQTNQNTIYYEENIKELKKDICDMKCLISKVFM